MSRAELTLWTAAMAALGWAGSADAQYRYAGPPVAEAYALSIELSRDAAALTYEVDQILCDCDDYDDVLEELCDLADELEDLNRLLREATYRPSQWRRACKRAEDVEEEVCELAEEVHEALGKLNRYQPRQTAFAPRGSGHYRSRYRSKSPGQIVLQFGTGGKIQLIQSGTQLSPRGVPYSSPYRAASQGYREPFVGQPLIDRLLCMQTLASEIHALAHYR